MQTQFRQVAIPITFGVAVAILSGCGDDRAYEGPQRAAVSGMVTLDGEPIPGGSIDLIGQEGDKTRNISATIKDGKYAFNEAAGPTFGEYRVEIRAFGSSDAEGGDIDSAVTEQVLPPEYNEQSTLKLTVDKALMENQDFKLGAK